MHITFNDVNNSGKVVGIGSNEKAKSIFSRLASSISGIKNNIVSFFSEKKSNVMIGDSINLNQIHQDLLNTDKESIQHTYNKFSAKSLKKNIEKSILRYPQEIEYTFFEKYNNPQDTKIKLNTDLWISTEIPTDIPQLENKGSISHTQYKSSLYFQSISNKNTFKN